MPDSTQGRTRHWPSLLGTAGLGLALVGPMALLVPRLFADAWRAPNLLPQAWGLRAVREVLRPGSETLAGLTNSITVAVVATMLSLALAWPAARSITRLPPRRRAIAFVAIASPLLVPAYATGLGLTQWLVRVGLADSLTGIVLAHLVYVLPYVTLALLPAMGGDLDALDEAARVAGASPLRSWFHVVIPSARGVVAAAALLGFLVSWAQVGTSLAIGGGIPMLPVIALPFARNDPQVAAALNVLLLLPPIAALWLSRHQLAGSHHRQ